MLLSFVVGLHRRRSNLALIPGIWHQACQFRCKFVWIAPWIETAKAIGGNWLRSSGMHVGILETKDIQKNKCVLVYTASCWLVFKWRLPLNLVFPVESLYRVVRVPLVCFSFFVSDPRSRALIVSELDHTQVRFQLKEPYFLIQNATLYVLVPKTVWGETVWVYQPLLAICINARLLQVHQAYIENMCCKFGSCDNHWKHLKTKS